MNYNACEAILCSRKSKDNTILKVFAKANFWKIELKRGKHKPIRYLNNLAAMKKVRESYVRRLLNLNYLSQKLKVLIIDGKQPKHLKLQDIVKDMPLNWMDQERRWMK